MTLPDDWWTTDLEDEPCDTCGVKPSKHEGHGAFVCKTCYEARWCPSCGFSLRPDPHVCPSPEEAARRRKEGETMLALLDADSFDAYRYGFREGAEAMRQALLRFIEESHYCSSKDVHLAVLGSMPAPESPIGGFPEDS